MIEPWVHSIVENIIIADPSRGFKKDIQRWDTQIAKNYLFE